MNHDGKKIIVYDKSAARFESLQIEKIASGFMFTEGPVWHPDNFLLFSDIPANQIWQLLPGGSTRIYLEQSGFSGTDKSELSEQIGSNGLAISAEDNLIICQHGNHALAQLDRYGELSILTSQYEDRRYNSPNDLTIHSNGSIYFTDPPYGLKDQLHHPRSFQPLGGVYRYKDGKSMLLSDDLRYPNGICLSPDENYLYVSSNHHDEPFLWQYQLSSTGEIKKRSVFIEQNADGIKTDKNGNLFLSTDKGVLIISPEARRLALLPIPETPANLAWSRPGDQELYITARSSIYRVRGFSS